MTGSGVGRSADQVNAEIRALWPPGAVAPTDRNRYDRLVMEWAAAKEAERVLGQQELAA